MQTDPYYSSYHVVHNSSFWKYKVYVGIRRGSLERRHQTIVKSRMIARAAVVC